jgi:hypothetical protein
MRRVFVLLLALAFLPVLCQAQIDVTDYQIDITATWIGTGAPCVSNPSNCTETISMDYEFESNLDVFNPASPTAGIYGWIPMGTMRETSSGFLGSFTPLFSPDLSNVLWVDTGRQLADGLPFFNSQPSNPQGDEIDLGNQGPGLSNSGPANVYIYNCRDDCHYAFPNYPSDNGYIPANYTTFTTVQMPSGDTEWELLLVSMFICTAGLWVKCSTSGA